MFRVTFWGVRGSIPSPGPHTAHFGGNTSCVGIECDDAQLIFDAGTGIRALGQQIVSRGVGTLHLFISHVHWDHIQGFPFFAPAFTKQTKIHLYGSKSIVGSLESAMAGQMEFRNFPVTFAELASEMVFHNIAPDQEIKPTEGVTVRAAPGHHPGGVLAYRIEYQGGSVVYMTDTEHGSDRDEGLLALCRDADVLIYDAMYTPEEYNSHQGWGHSTNEVGAKMATDAGVKQLVLFHHDPDQDDDAVRAKQEKTKLLFANSVAAFEGMQIEVR